MYLIVICRKSFNSLLLSRRAVPSRHCVTETACRRSITIRKTEVLPALWPWRHRERYCWTSVTLMTGTGTVRKKAESCIRTRTPMTGWTVWPDPYRTGKEWDIPTIRQKPGKSSAFSSTGVSWRRKDGKMLRRVTHIQIGVEETFIIMYYMDRWYLPTS